MSEKFEDRAVCLAEAINTRKYNASFGGVRPSELGYRVEFWYDLAKQRFVVRETEMLWTAWLPKYFPCAAKQAKALLERLPEARKGPVEFKHHGRYRCRVYLTTNRQGQVLAFEFPYRSKDCAMVLSPGLSRHLLELAADGPMWAEKIRRIAT